MVYDAALSTTPLVSEQEEPQSPKGVMESKLLATDHSTNSHLAPYADTLAKSTSLATKLRRMKRRLLLEAVGIDFPRYHDEQEEEKLKSIILIHYASRPQ